MILSRPKSTALFSLSVFIIVALSLAYAGISGPAETGIWHWYNYIAVYFFGPLALLLSFRLMYNFKVITLEKGEFRIKYPFRFRKLRLKLSEMISWNEEKVKTGKTTFRQLKLNFNKKVIKLSNQENTSYDQIFNYLNKKHKSTYVE